MGDSNHEESIMKSIVLLSLIALTTTYGLPSAVAGIKTRSAEEGRASSQPAEVSARAVIVGVARYADARVPSLRGPAIDTAAMRDRLQAAGVGNFDILADETATRKTILAAVGRQVTENVSQLIVYFSGHTTQSRVGNGDLEFHCCPYEYTPEDNAAVTGFSVPDLVRVASTKPPKEMIILLDGQGATEYDLARIKTAIAENLPKTNVLVCWAAGPNQTASEIRVDWDGGRLSAGAFTHALTSELRSLEQSQSASATPARAGWVDVFAGVRTRMIADSEKYASQCPYWIAVIQNGLPMLPVPERALVATQAGILTTQSGLNR